MREWIPIGMLCALLGVCPLAAAAGPPDEVRELNGVAVDPLSGGLSITYSPACNAANHNLYFGSLGAVSSYAFSGEVLLGASGTASGLIPGPGSFYFVVVGNDGDLAGSGIEGSYGRDGAGQERPEYLGDLFGFDQLLEDTDGDGTTDACDACPNDASAGGCPDAVGTLHVGLEAARGENGGDLNAVRVCLNTLSGVPCPAVCEPGTNCLVLDDREGLDEFRGGDGQVDVWSSDDVAASRASVSFVRIESEQVGSWVPSCIEVSFDGQVVYCGDPGSPLGIGQPLELALQASPDPACTCFGTRLAARPLSHGPMIGAVTTDAAGASVGRIWARTDATRRLELRVAETAEELAAIEPIAVTYTDARNDFAHTFTVDGLAEDTTYHYLLAVDGIDAPIGSFHTPPTEGSSVVLDFAFGSCMKHSDPGHVLFDDIAAGDPDLFLFAGDNHYAETDDLAALRQFYRWGFERDPRAALLFETPTLAVWDDHDFLGDDSDGNFEGRERALKAFREYWANPAFGNPIVPDDPLDPGAGVFFNYRYGDVEFFVLDGRYHRRRGGLDGAPWGTCEVTGDACLYDCTTCEVEWISSGGPPPERLLICPQLASSLPVPIGTCDDCVSGRTSLSCRDLTFLGQEQTTWLQQGLLESESDGMTFKLLVEGSSWSSEGGEDSWGASAFDDGHARLQQFIADHEIEGVLLLAGDLHRTELRRLPGGADARFSDGMPTRAGYTLPMLVASPTARMSNSFCDEPSNELLYCEGGGDRRFFVRAAIDTTSIDPTLTATVYEYTDGAPAVVRAAWTVFRSELVNPTVVPLDAEDPDFNGDGYADLAIGIPDQDLPEAVDAGSVLTLLGSSAGLTTRGIGSFRQKGGAVAGASEPDDRMGAALAVGDFDGDGFDDLAAGTPGETVGGIVGAGAVNVIYGSDHGLDADDDANPPGDKLWSENTSGVKGTAETADSFGATLAAGDFNGDGYSDLAIGVPGQDGSAGKVHILHGTSAGLTSETPNDQEWDQLTTAACRTADYSTSEFGQALAVGRFNGDAFDDLAIGAPFANVGVHSSAGAVLVLLGSPSGLKTTGCQEWHQDVNGVPDESASGDVFGAALAAGDFDGNGVDDLAIGSPGEGGPGPNAGKVHVIVGSPAGLTTSGAQLWTHADGGIPGVEDDDAFGFALATADFDGDGFEELAVGAPGAGEQAGTIVVFRGSPAGLIDPDEVWTEDDATSCCTAEPNDRFGSAMAAADYNADGHDDLAVGAPGESVNRQPGAGLVLVFLGSPSGLATHAGPLSLTAPYDQRWHLELKIVPDDAQAGDALGASLR